MGISTESIRPKNKKRSSAKCLEIRVSCSITFLGVRQRAWKEEQRSVGYSETSRLLTELKRNPEFVWLNLSDSMSLQESLRDLDNGFQHFFAGDAKYPKFKSKHNAKKSYLTRNQNNGIRIEGNKIRLPRIGFVKIKLSRIPDCPFSPHKKETVV